MHSPTEYGNFCHRGYYPNNPSFLPANIVIGSAASIGKKETGKDIKKLLEKFILPQCPVLPRPPYRTLYWVLVLFSLPVLWTGAPKITNEQKKKCNRNRRVASLIQETYYSGVGNQYPCTDIILCLHSIRNPLWTTRTASGASGENSPRIQRVIHIYCIVYSVGELLSSRGTTNRVYSTSTPENSPFEPRGSHPSIIYFRFDPEQRRQVYPISGIKPENSLRWSGIYIYSPTTWVHFTPPYCNSLGRGRLPIEFFGYFSTFSLAMNFIYEPTRRWCSGV